MNVVDNKLFMWYSIRNRCINKWTKEGIKNELIYFRNDYSCYTCNFLKVKNVKKVGAVIGTLILILLIVFGITFLLEKPDVNITGTQMNVEVKQANSLKAPKTVYHFKDISNELKVVGNVDFDKVGVLYIL